MKTKIYQFITIVCVLVLLQSFAYSNENESSKKWIRPLDAIWKAIRDLQQQIEEIIAVKYDKQIRIPMISSQVGLSKITIDSETLHIHRFNKANYYNINSVVFSVTTYGSGSIVLYNITDDVEVCEISYVGEENDYVYLESENIINALPEKEITLGIKSTGLIGLYNATILIERP